jgi:hypothetical protein
LGFGPPLAMARGFYAMGIAAYCYFFRNSSMVSYVHPKGNLGGTQLQPSPPLLRLAR